MLAIFMGIGSWLRKFSFLLRKGCVSDCLNGKWKVENGKWF